MSLLNNFEEDDGAHKAERHADIPTVSPVDNYKLMLKRGGILAPLTTSGTTASLRDTITTKSLPFNNPHPVDFDVDFQGHSGLVNKMHHSQGGISNKYEHTYEYGDSGNEKEERDGGSKGVYLPAKVTSNMESTQTDEPEYTTAYQQNQQNANIDNKGEMKQYDKGHGELDQSSKTSSNAKSAEENMPNYKFNNHENVDRPSNFHPIVNALDGKNEQEMKEARPTQGNQQRIGNYGKLGEHQEPNREAKVSKEGATDEDKKQPSGNKMTSEEKESTKERKPNLSNEELNSQGKNFKNNNENDAREQSVMTEKEVYVSVDNTGQKYKTSTSNDDGKNTYNYQANDQPSNSHGKNMNNLNEVSNNEHSNNMPTTGPQQGPKQQFKIEKEDALSGNHQKQQNQPKYQDFENNYHSVKPTALNEITPTKENSFQGKNDDKGEQKNYSVGAGTYDGDKKIKDPKLKAELYNQYVYKQELQNNKKENEENYGKNSREFSKEEEENNTNMNRYEGTLYKDQKEETTDKFGNVIAKQKYKGTLFLYDKDGKDGKDAEKQDFKNEPTKKQNDREPISKDAKAIKGYDKEQNGWKDIEGQIRNERTQGEKTEMYHSSYVNEKAGKESDAGNSDRNDKNYGRKNEKASKNESMNKEIEEKSRNRFEDNGKSLNEQTEGEKKPKSDENRDNAKEEQKNSKEFDSQKDRKAESSQVVNEQSNQDLKPFQHGHEHEPHEHEHEPHGHEHEPHGHEHDGHIEHEEHVDEPGHMMKPKFNGENKQKQGTNDDNSKNFEFNKSHENSNESEKNKQSDKGGEKETQGYHFDTGDSRDENRDKSKNSGNNEMKENEKSENENRNAAEKEDERKIDQNKDQGLKNAKSKDRNDDVKWKASDAEDQRKNDEKANKQKAFNESQKNEDENKKLQGQRNSERGNDKERQRFEGNDKEEQIKGSENNSKFQGKDENDDKNKNKNSDNEKTFSDQQKTNNNEEYQGKSKNENEKNKQIEDSKKEERKDDQRKIEKMEEKLEKSEKEPLKNQNSGQASIADLEKNGNGYETINDIVKYPRKNFRSSKNLGESSNIEENRVYSQGPTIRTFANKKGSSPEIYNDKPVGNDNERPIVNKFHSEMNRIGEDLRNIEEVKKQKKIEDDENEEIKGRNSKQTDESKNGPKSSGKYTSGDSKSLKLGPKGPSAWHKQPQITQTVVHHGGVSRDEEYANVSPKKQSGKGPSLQHLNILPNQIKTSETKLGQKTNSNNVNKQIEVIQQPNNGTGKQQQQQMDPEQQMLMKESEKAGKMHFDCIIINHRINQINFMKQTKRMIKLKLLAS